MSQNLVNIKKGKEISINTLKEKRRNSHGRFLRSNHEGDHYAGDRSSFHQFRLLLSLGSPSVRCSRHRSLPCQRRRPLRSFLLISFFPFQCLYYSQFFLLRYKSEIYPTWWTERSELYWGCTERKYLVFLRVNLTAINWTREDRWWNHCSECCSTKAC